MLLRLLLGPCLFWGKMRLPEDLRAHTAPENTPAARWVLTNVPKGSEQWSFACHPGRAANVQAIQWLEAWASRPGGPPGVALWGPAGTGKTGLSLSAARLCAERGDGDRGLWNVLTMWLARGTGLIGEMNPSPVWFESWASLSMRLRRARRGGPGEDEEILEYLEENVDLLALDDLDVGELTAWKEEMLLRMLLRAEMGKRLIVTMNIGPESFVGRYGERCADRLLDSSRFTLVPMYGRSLRRRE